MCILQFPEELLHLKAPFIKVGLEANEFCMWITGEPVTEKDAFKTCKKSFPMRRLFSPTGSLKPDMQRPRGLLGFGLQEIKWQRLILSS